MACVRQLQIGEAAYVAGIIDGEGTITLTRIHRGENRRPVVSISSTERALLEYVQLVVGAGRITNKRRSRAHHSPVLLTSFPAEMPWHFCLRSPHICTPTSYIEQNSWSANTFA
jgi:hypothetical protein